jgi:hypothetical protein
MAEELTEVLNKLLANRPFDDPCQVLSILVEAIIYKTTDTALIEQVVQQVINKYENRLKIFQIGVAQAQLERILRMIKLLDKIEDEITKFVPGMENNDLIKTYATTQVAFTQSLEYIKKISELKIDITQLGSIKEESTEPYLIPSHKRKRLRSVVEAVLETVNSSEELDADKEV